MNWYIKTGAFYRTPTGYISLDKRKAQRYDAKGGALPLGFFWSRESVPYTGEPRTQAGQREVAAFVALHEERKVAA